jgi:hypothetical protein
MVGVFTGEETSAEAKVKKGEMWLIDVKLNQNLRHAASTQKDIKGGLKYVSKICDCQGLPEILMRGDVSVFHRRLF